MNRIHRMNAFAAALLLVAPCFSVAASAAGKRATTQTSVSLIGLDKPTPPEPKPYVWRSLAKATDAELVRLMGPGKNARDFENETTVRNRAPADFWTLKPRDAALALAEMNRTESHKGQFKIGVDETTSGALPEICTLAFSEESSRCYNAVDWYYFLRVDPAGSYLAYGSLRSGGVVFYSVVFDQPGFDLRYCPLSYEDARQVASVIWWLNRVRSEYKEPRSFAGETTTLSTADGAASLALRDGDGVNLVEQTGTIWGGSQISERWTGKYQPEVAVNLIDFLVTKELPRRLGDAWKQSTPPANRSKTLGVDRGPAYTEEQLRHVSGMTQRFLGLYSEKQDKLSNALVACAASAAGTLALSETKEALEKIKNARPPVVLRDVVDTALVKLEVADDPAALYEWAASKTPGSQWAMQRLAGVDPTRYLQALEWWLDNMEPRATGQIFAEIRRINPARATELAAKMASPAKGNPADSETSASRAKPVLSALDRAKEIADEPSRVIALINVLVTPSSGWQDRWAAISLLVPEDDPLHYPQPEIDAALLRVLKPDQVDAQLRVTVAYACRALASRQRTEAFDSIAEVFVSGAYDVVQTDEVLAALVCLAQADPGQLRPKMKALLAPHLISTSKRIPQLLEAFWALDLRDFLPAMEQLATADPDDYEDDRATGYREIVMPTAGRFHSARKIADLWNAEDPLTEIRSLMAFALHRANGIGIAAWSPESARFKSTIRSAGDGLTTSQRTQLNEFFVFVLALPEGDSYLPKKSREKLVSLVKEEIAAR